ncbi:hypothetical protein AMELA_G00250130 [Ameiurus melas]|uniref:Uncharacterized protein n=1 Tax=Ameiurus melas TaxID=219545 RepID=A0A7J5ZVU5_AMEME|nr:hypothetical protein AMELA_G00250130 [Ameiurus melas]
MNLESSNLEHSIERCCIALFHAYTQEQQRHFPACSAPPPDVGSRVTSCGLFWPFVSISGSRACADLTKRVMPL